MEPCKKIPVSFCFHFNCVTLITSHHTRMCVCVCVCVWGCNQQSKLISFCNTSSSFLTEPETGLPVTFLFFLFLIAFPSPVQHATAAFFPSPFPTAFVKWDENRLLPSGDGWCFTKVDAVGAGGEDNNRRWSDCRRDRILLFIPLFSLYPSNVAALMWVCCRRELAEVIIHNFGEPFWWRSAAKVIPDLQRPTS